MAKPIRTSEYVNKIDRPMGFLRQRATDDQGLVIDGYVITRLGIVLVWARLFHSGDKSIELRFIFDGRSYSRLTDQYSSTRRLVTLANQYAEEIVAREMEP